MKIVRDISNSDPIPLIWKYLRNFLDIDSTSKRIKQIHNIEDTNQDSNVKKQAEQLKYCIQQAEQYFKAARQVSLAIKPLLLYYGSVNLSQALVLLRQDGNYSFDTLRKKKTHKHHGLELKVNSIPHQLNNIPLQDILNSIQCKIHLKDDNPWGQFTLFFNSLSAPAVKIKNESHIKDENAFLESYIAQNTVDIIKIDEIKNNIFNCFDLVSTLPDCYHSLLELGILPNVFRGSIIISTVYQYISDENGNKKLQKLTDDHTATIDGLSSDVKKKMLSYLSSKNSLFSLESDFGRHIILKAHVEPDPHGIFHFGHYPDVVDDIDGNLYYINDPDNYLIEPASFFMILFCYGMLSRYYPDLWMNILQNSVKFVEFTDSLINHIERKFPNLILDQMTDVKHSFHL